MTTPLLERAAVGTPLSTLVAGSWQVTRTRHEPNLRLRAHRHARANLVCVLRGGFAETIGATTYECGSRSVLVKPAGEAHSNHYGTSGAHCVIVEPLPSAIASLGRVGSLFDAAGHLSEPGLSLIASEIFRELGRADADSRLAVESLAIELVARAARVGARERRAMPLIRRVRDFLHAHFRDDIALSDVAAAVGRHPAHVVRLFREAQNCTVGTYVRRLRLEWAASELLATGRPVAEIALGAGFCDHSHFCRVFKARFGTSPAEFRRGGGAAL